MRDFHKPATTYVEQVALLQRRGMFFDDVPSACRELRNLNYYRLAAYWLPFEADHATHAFRAGTKFSMVLNLYRFDRALRMLLLDAIEHVEVAFRAIWAYETAHRHGPHSYLERNITSDHHIWFTSASVILKEVGRSSERFIAHHLHTYKENLPPVWAVSEVLSFGTVSRCYANLAPVSTRRAIAAVFGVDHTCLESWLRHFSYLRNLCAHHLRVWNRDLTIIPQLPRTKPVELGVQCVAGSRRLYNSLVLLVYCLSVLDVMRDVQRRFKDIAIRYSVPLNEMGFPEDWSSFPVWKR